MLISHKEPVAKAYGLSGELSSAVGTVSTDSIRLVVESVVSAGASETVGVSTTGAPSLVGGTEVLVLVDATPLVYWLVELTLWFPYIF